jgi:hypothetical protein
LTHETVRRGWSREKRKTVEKAFYEFLARCYINSKDTGRVSLGKSLYDGQRRFISAVFDALEEDIHEIYVLKSRQLGLSTIARALTMFMLGVHNGLKGAVVFDTDTNKQESRSELTVMINDLPSSLKFPKIASDNRMGLTLNNDSKLLFMSAGVKRTKTSGTLGRSVGLSLAHLSELCSWDNDEGLEAFQQSLSDVNPDRLYIYESTARGFNLWHTMWKAARVDPMHCKCIFLGWWSKPSQSIPKDSPDFRLYGIYPPSDKELARMQTVKEKYGHDITEEQLAWVRRKMNPGAAMADLGDSAPDFEGSNLRLAEQAWTEDEAFQQTGATFFSAEALTDQTRLYASKNHKNYWFQCGEEFINTKVYKARTYKDTQLKVWEEPVVGASYVVGVDPAFGVNEANDHSAIEVLRCYADGVDQVAEYTAGLTTTRHLAWVLSAIMGWYGAGENMVRYILELAGPGYAVFNALKDLQVYLRVGHKMKEVEEQGLSNVFQNVQAYIYQRADAMGPGFNYHWLASHDRKVMVMESLRDYVTNGTFRIRSSELIDEMNRVARQDDGGVEAPKSQRDDRVIAAALATYCWLQKDKQALMAQKRTREAEEAKSRLSIRDQVVLYNQNTLDTFFQQKQRERLNREIQQRRSSWRSGGYSRRY